MTSDLIIAWGTPGPAARAERGLRLIASPLACLAVSDLQRRSPRDEQAHGRRVLPVLLPPRLAALGEKLLRGRVDRDVQGRLAVLLRGRPEGARGGKGAVPGTWQAHHSRKRGICQLLPCRAARPKQPQCTLHHAGHNDGTRRTLFRAPRSAPGASRSSSRQSGQPPRIAAMSGASPPRCGGAPPRVMGSRRRRGERGGERPVRLAPRRREHAAAAQPTSTSVEEQQHPSGLWRPRRHRARLWHGCPPPL